MRVLKFLSIIFLILAIGFIPVSFFNTKYRQIFGIVGYSLLIIGQILNMIRLIDTQKKDLKNK